MRNHIEMSRETYRFTRTHALTGVSPQAAVLADGEVYTWSAHKAIAVVDDAPAISIPQVVLAPITQPRERAEKMSQYGGFYTEMGPARKKTAPIKTQVLGMAPQMFGTGKFLRAESLEPKQTRHLSVPQEARDTVNLNFPPRKLFDLGSRMYLNVKDAIDGSRPGVDPRSS